ncbi:MAG: alpha/beta fold hydrolase [Candidatus Pacebacteria bacterium]|nr:alpha/beta fold hydrolase [Candidatus Paceibacterota bacterium]
MKRVFLVHGWGGSPDREWFPWLSTELEKRGFTAVALALPDSEHPHIDAWVSALAAAVGTPDADTYFVGHSMGCQTVARYLAELDESITVGGIVYVGGYFDTLTLGEDEEVGIWDEWREAPVDLARVRARAPKSIAFFSDDDPYVPLENAKRFELELGSKVIIEHAQSHFNGDAYAQIPFVLDAVLELAQS